MGAGESCLLRAYSSGFRAAYMRDYSCPSACSTCRHVNAKRNHNFGISGTSSGSNSSGWRVERFDGLLKLGKLPDLSGGVKAFGEEGWLLAARADCIRLGAMA